MQSRKDRRGRSAGVTREPTVERRSSRLGTGVNYITGHDAGFALQPRLGMSFLIGRSGVLTPALNVNYSTVHALRTAAGTILAVQTTYGMNIGYTVMW